MSRKSRPVPYIALLVLALMACNPCSFLSGRTPQEPVPTITVSAEAAQRLQDRLYQELQENPNPQFILRITNNEITSLVSQKLAESPAPPIQEPRIWFTRGRIYVSGKLVNILPSPTDSLLVASVHVEDGQIRIQFDKATIGSMNVPKLVLNELQQTVNDALATAQIDVTITEVQILEGEMVIAGRK